MGVPAYAIGRGCSALGSYNIGTWQAACRVAELEVPTAQ